MNKKVGKKEISRYRGDAKMYRTVKTSILLAAVILLAAGAMAQAPHTIQYQGRLTDATGSITSAVNVAFRIYDVESGGTALWTETHSGLIPDHMGVFTVQLGSIVPFGLDVFTGQPRYLGITVGADAEMTPRQLISAAPYSLGSPGVAYNFLDGYVVTSTLSAPMSIEVNTTLPGYLILEATGWVMLGPTASEAAWCALSISSDAASLEGSTLQWLWEVPNPSGYVGLERFSVRSVVPAGPGAHTFYLTAQQFYATTDCELINVYLTATFIPTWIGTAAPPVVTSSGKLTPELFEEMKARITDGTSEKNR
jgi:hypothetical protein